MLNPASTFKQYVILTIIISSLLLLVSCSTPGVKTELTTIPESEESTKLSNSDKERYREAITHLYKGDYSSAKRIFNEFARLYPNLAGAFSNLALIHYKQTNYDKSLELSTKAISLNPEQSQAYNIRAQSYVQLGKIHEAKADYFKAIELKPEYPNAQYNLALLYDIYLQDIELSIKHYEIYMKLIDNQDETTREWINHLKGTLANG